MAELLRDAYVSAKPIPPLSETHPGTTLDDAYRVQQEQVRQWVESGDAVRGHKIGLASAAMQEQMGVDQPDFGHITDAMLFTTGAAVNLKNFLQPRIEPEVAFVLRESLRGPGVGLAEAARAVEGVLPALEIVDSRIEDWRLTIVDTVADNASTGGVILGGSPIALEDVDLPNLRCVLKVNGEPVAAGTGAAVLGSPLYALAWLANKLGSLGVTLEAGHVVLSGSFTRAVPIASEDIVTAEFAGFGTVSAQFVDGGR